MFPKFSRNFLFNSTCPTLLFHHEREKLKAIQVLQRGLDLAIEFHLLGLQDPIDLQVILELMIPLVHKDHIYQDHKVHLLQILQQHQMAIFLLHLLMETLQMEILPHLLLEVMVVPHLLQEVMVVVPQTLVEILMGLQAQVETLLPLLPEGVGEEGDHLLLHRHKAVQMDHRVQIFPLSTIEAELQTPELPHKS